MASATASSSSDPARLLAEGLPAAAIAAAGGSFAPAEAVLKHTTAVEAACPDVVAWLVALDEGSISPLGVPLASGNAALSAAVAADALLGAVPHARQPAPVLLARAVAAWSRGRVSECAMLARLAGSAPWPSRTAGEGTLASLSRPKAVSTLFSALALARAGDLPEAEAAALRAAKLDPDAAGATAKPLLRCVRGAAEDKARATAAYRAGRYAEAKELYMGAARWKGEEAAGLLSEPATLLGNAAAAAVAVAGSDGPSLAEGRALASRAVRSSPTDSRAWAKLGAVLGATGAAAAAFRVAAALAGPGQALGLAGRGMAAEAAAAEAEAAAAAAAGGQGRGGQRLVTAASDGEWGVAARKAMEAGQAVVADYSATWCGPCRTLAPHFARQAEAVWPLARLVSVDVDKCPQTAAAAKVSAVPHVTAYVAGREAGTVKGADAGKIDELVAGAIVAAAAARRAARGVPASWPACELDGVVRLAAAEAAAAGVDEAQLLLASLPA